MKSWKRIYGMNRDRRYAASGTVNLLASDFIYLQGWRRILEQWSIFLTSWANRWIDQGPLYIELEEVDRNLEGIESAFFLLTECYKDTFFVGPVISSRGSRWFIKLYKSEKAAILNEERSRLASLISDGVFLPIPLHERRNRLLVFPFYRRFKKRDVTVAELDQIALKLGQKQLMGATKSRRLKELVDISYLIETHPNLGKSLEKISEISVPVALSHGDLTPWNAFLDENERVRVIDYERVAERSPFYDRFHLHTQPRILSGFAKIPFEVFQRLHLDEKIAKETIVQWYICYLCDQIAMDCREFEKFGRSHSRITKVIQLKLKVLSEILYEYQKDSLRSSRM